MSGPDCGVVDLAEMHAAVTGKGPAAMGKSMRNGDVGDAMMSAEMTATMAASKMSTTTKMAAAVTTATMAPTAAMASTAAPRESCAG